ncbi:SRPBCC family protein [Novosphingobium sp. PhB165]|uniref:SRPBCC family protein n=1 Tax=Novosphingobium sp. PhB165 TaxID=2485105 RepID=UPI001048716D|nr:SRPBCC family protein [Novosphingobium sp. PhB165]
MKKAATLALFAMAGLGALAAAPAQAKVQEASERGIVMRYVAHVPVGADEAWAVLVKPSQWWDSEHTYSGSSANLSLDARPGGCFCEVLPDKDAPKAAPRGGVEHMRVIYIDKGRALRLTGALGPLQADAAVGTLTFQFKPDETGTQILVEYVVGGYFRTDAARLATMLDRVLAGQVDRFVEKLGGSFAAAFRPDTLGAVGEPPAGPADKPQDAPPVKDDKTRIIGR